MTIYRYTHNTSQRIPLPSTVATLVADETIPRHLSLQNLVVFCTLLFLAEFRALGFDDSVVMGPTCNVTEWRRRLYAGSRDTPLSDEIDLDTVPALPSLSQAGVVYGATVDQGKVQNEEFSAMLFACHKPSIAPTLPSSNSGSLSVDLIPTSTDLSLGVTHIWLCGSDPASRRHGQMSALFSLLESEVAEWKSQGLGNGLITVHTIPQCFPGMVKFLHQKGFQGGDLVKSSSSDGKVLYWKQL